ncbi:MAG: spermidine synthase [Gammaproteobacteria bacterium]
MLGLGGGGLAHSLSHYYPQMTIQLVELRQAVIDVAYEWFNLPQSSQLHVTQGDAMAYMANAKCGSTDIIFSDLYQAEAMSECQAQQDFVKHCYRALSEQGCLVINYHAMPDNDAPVMHGIRKLFSEIVLCDVANGNRIVFCCKKTVLFSCDSLTERAEVLVQQVEMPLMYYYHQLQKFSI